jgi:peptidoglycan-associated lipoprotein
MYFKILTLIAAAALVPACSTPSEEQSTSGGTGGALTSATSQSSPSAAPTAKTVPSSPAELAGPNAGTQDDLVINIGDQVFFGYDKYDITAASNTTLEGQAAWLKKYPSTTIAIEGHCDERGTREYNLALGERRANAVKDYLVALGVSANRIQTISYGKERPVALGSNDGAWAQNRRGVTVVKPAAGN